MAFNKCQTCGESEVPERADFCISCGRAMQDEAIGQKTDATESNPPLPSNGFVIGAAVVVIGVFIAIFRWGMSTDPIDTTTNTNINSIANTQKADELFTEYVRKDLCPTAEEAANWTKEERAKRKKRGVNIGMNKIAVLASNWGKPKSVNTTTTAYGEREQWVYGLRSYLYFEDGVLTSIQN